MLTDIISMTGETPRVPPHLVETGVATMAKNCEFTQGVIDPVKTDAGTGKVFNFIPKTIWRYRDDFWFAFPEHADIITSPVAQDAFGRIYWSDGKYPKYTTAEFATKGYGNYPAYSFRLGIPVPQGKIHVSVNSPVHYSDTIIPPKLPDKPAKTATEWSVMIDGSEHTYGTEALAKNAWNAEAERIKALPPVYEPAKPDPTEAVTRFYTQTFVSDLGEEGAPGEPSEEVTLPWDDSTVTLTLQSAGIENSRVTRRRIYRTASGGGIAGYLLVAELPISQGTFTDSIPDSQLSAPLETTNYLPPPENMQGLCMMANGIAAGFTGNTVHFSAAYLPYAWVPSYQLTTSADIVGIAPIGTSLVVTTTAEPWMFSGVTPGAITGVRLPIIAPCSSRDSIVAMGNMVIYASPRGLVAVDASGSAELVSDRVMTTQQWQGYNPKTIKAWQWRGEYYAWHGSGVMIFSPQAGSIRHLDTGGAEYSAVYSDSDRDCYYFASHTLLYQGQQGKPAMWHWKSGIFLAPQGTTYACLHIRAHNPSAVGIRIYADGEQVAHLPRGSLSGCSSRLPAVTAKQWQIEAWGNTTLERITMAATLQEMPT